MSEARKEKEHQHDPLRPARGVALGVFLGSCLWAAGIGAWWLLG
jgi:hypothetical protein